MVRFFATIARCFQAESGMRRFSQLQKQRHCYEKILQTILTLNYLQSEGSYEPRTLLQYDNNALFDNQ